MPRPELAIVLWRGRDGDAPALTGLAAIARDDLEIILVDECDAPAPPGVRRVQQGRAGRVAGYNLGVFTSAAGSLCFLHERVALSPSVAEGVLAATRGVDARSVFYCPSRHGLEREAFAWRAPESLLVMSRELLVHHGVFDPDFEDGWERVELFWRLRARRLRLRRLDGLACDAPIASVQDLIARSRSQGAAHVRLAQRHPSVEMTAFAALGASRAYWARHQHEAPALIARAQAASAPDNADYLPARRALIRLHRAEGVASAWPHA